ncbi:uncharacterized protein PAC_18501 [Phialocephala subalpina]|uniref:Rasp f 7 allergen n=1 Tax=Phialocephala subalpina TaxID=576137 RepID=A0A1L7XU99_9HELO|nr:uncharacterized protein PAC_18501 [Phialocephala subalpina]
MLFQSAAILLALSASFVAAAPSPVEVEVLAPSPVGAPLAKRTTHVGTGTVYLQGGNAGSCGETNPDSAIIAAIGNFWMDDESPGPYCGRLIQITNTGSNDGVGGDGNVVTVQVEDTCPSCGEGDIDLSVGAWDKLTNSAAFGTFEISWHFCNVDGQC